MRAVVYCRISQDRIGAGLGVARQREDCEHLARDRDWTVTAIYEDNDISAYSGRLRPGYRKLLEDIQLGEIDVVIAWHTDRLHRSPLELEEYISACESRNVATTTVRAGELDLSTAAGRMIARMLGAAARHESEQKSERVRRAREQEARNGQVHGKLGYGWEELDGKWKIIPAEAAVIREIANRLLKGESLAGIARDLNKRSIPTPGGLIGAWRGSNIGQMITAGRYCGWREWTPAESRGGRGRGRGLGNLVAEGDWPAILKLDTTERLRLLISDPARNSNGGGRPARARYLLSAGVARCGRCNAPLSGTIDRRYMQVRYICVSQVGLNRCGRLAIAADPVDEFVSEAVIEVLTGSHVQSRTAPNHAAETEPIQSLRERLNELTAMYANDEISRQEWLAQLTLPWVGS